MNSHEKQPPRIELPRRKDRAIEDDGWIGSFLSKAPFGMLASVRDGRPILNSNLFVYDADRHLIFVHTARHGATRTSVEKTQKVAFSVAEMGRLLPADTALKFSVEYAGVVVFGTGRILSERREARRALQMLLEKYCPHLKPGRDYRAITEDELKRTSVFCVEIESWSGKRKQVAEDFPGAFYYPQSETTFPQYSPSPKPDSEID